jgi:hypothetical protein
LHFTLLKCVAEVAVILNEDVWGGGGTAQRVRLSTAFPVLFTLGEGTSVLSVQGAEWTPEPATRYGERKSLCPLRVLNPCRHY